MANRAYKFRIYPNREQEVLMKKTFGCCRFVYNRMLSDKIESYKNTGKMLRSERYTGPYARSFHIGKDIDCENAGAAYTDGVLKITLRKIRKVPATIDIQ